MSFEIKRQISLKNWCGWKVGGEAEYFCLPKNLSELKKACAWAEDKKTPISILSGGTNTLVSSYGVKGLVIVLKNLSSLSVSETDQELKIQALSGVSKTQLFKIFLKREMAASLFLSGLPGDVGGGVAMNAGVSFDVFPYEFSQIVDWIEVLSFKKRELQVFRKKDLKWAYRSCSGWGEGLIYQVGFKQPKEKLENFHQQIRRVHKKRLSSQPLNHPSCGSVFKNPSGKKAGKLIEQSGLKGFKIGGAEVSRKHANFILNKDLASAEDIYHLILHIQNKVKQDAKVFLEPEVRFLGKWEK